MAVTVMNVVHRVAVRHGRVPTALAVLVSVALVGHVPARLALVPVPGVPAVQVPAVRVVDMVAVRHLGVPAVRVVHVRCGG
jgi:hypothetical protein